MELLCNEYDAIYRINACRRAGCRGGKATMKTAPPPLKEEATASLPAIKSTAQIETPDFCSSLEKPDSPSIERCSISISKVTCASGKRNRSAVITPGEFSKGPPLVVTDNEQAAVEPNRVLGRERNIGKRQTVGNGW